MVKLAKFYFSLAIVRGWFPKPVLGHVLRHLLGRHMLGHMPEYVLKHVPKHLAAAH